MKRTEGVGRVISGKVVRSKMEKTVAVEIERIVAHPVYGKYIRRTETLLVHDEHNEAQEGDVVNISACRPLSKRKVWKLQTIASRAK